MLMVICVFCCVPAKIRIIATFVIENTLNFIQCPKKKLFYIDCEEEEEKEQETSKEVDIHKEPTQRRKK